MVSGQPSRSRKDQAIPKPAGSMILLERAKPINDRAIITRR
jgi:hypothetical protein